MLLKEKMLNFFLWENVYIYDIGPISLSCRTLNFLFWGKENIVLFKKKKTLHNTCTNNLNYARMHVL